ncbi:MAG: hypothetical protein PVG41_21450 [Desulfobacteraceae bacterium]
MDSNTVRNKRLIALFLLSYILLNDPILSLFNLPRLVFGIPLLFFYIFGVWILLIVLVALIVSFKSSAP